jgi:hypothetical protein
MPSHGRRGERENEERPSKENYKNGNMDRIIKSLDKYRSTKLSTHPPWQSEGSR